MKKIIFLKYVVIVTLLFALHTIFYKPPQRTYNLNVVEKLDNCILSDDFNNKLNTNYWNLIERGNNVNKESQYYIPQNISINDGNLVATAKLEDYKDHNYTSGFVDTKNKFEFLYGKIIFRARPPKGDGLLTAVWLLPADDTYFPEIDIIEVLGEKNNEVWSGVHYLTESIINSSFKTNQVDDDDFFIYELVWEKGEIRGYINNKLIYKTNVGVPDKKMYLIINLAVGGVWPKKVDDNIFPKELLIDYIVIIPETCGGQ